MPVSEGRPEDPVLQHRTRVLHQLPGCRKGHGGIPLGPGQDGQVSRRAVGAGVGSYRVLGGLGRGPFCPCHPSGIPLFLHISKKQTIPPLAFC